MFSWWAEFRGVGVNSFSIVNLRSWNKILWRNTEGTCTYRLFCTRFQNRRSSLYAPLKRGIFNSQSFPFKGKICLESIMNTSFWWRWTVSCTLHGIFCARQLVPYVWITMTNIMCVWKLTYCVIYKHALSILCLQYL